MGLFNRKKQSAATPLADKVYYSTPFGETKNGDPRPFLFARDGVPYIPVFRSPDSMKEFYEQADRAAYMILEGDVQSVLNTNRSIEVLRRVDVVVEPLGDDPVFIAPSS